MAQLDRAALITKINNWITTNGNREITGAQLNEILEDLTDSAWNLTEDGTGSGGGSQTYVESGCQVVYDQNLDYIGQGGGNNLAYFQGVPVTPPGNTVTLANADPTNPRLDAIVLKSDGQYDKVTGDASANPTLKSIDPATQILRAIALVNAGAGTPAGVTILNLYNENLGTGGGEDADFSTNDGANIDPDDGTQPSDGVKNIKVSGAGGGNGKRFDLTLASAVQKAVFSNLPFKIYLGGTNVNKIFVYLRDSGSGNNVATCTIQNGVAGYNKSQTGQHQHLVLTQGDFTWGAGTEFDQVRMEWQTAGNPTFYFDEIQIQTGLSQPGPNTELERLLPQASQVLTSSGNAVAWNVANNVRAYHNLTENTEIQIPTNYEPGDELRIEIESDGASTLTWAAGYRKVDGEDIELDGTEADGERFIFTLAVLHDSNQILVIKSGKHVAA